MNPILTLITALLLATLNSLHAKTARLKYDRGAGAEPLLAI